MSVYFYDEALAHKLKSWTENTDLTVYSPSDTRRLLEVVADKSNDKPIKLPLICIRRKPGYEIQIPNRQVLSYDGLTPEATIEKSIQINAIPITLQYQLDIYTRYLKEADEYARNLIFNIVNFPQLTIKLPYMDNYFNHDSSISITSEVDDNSDVPERLISGQFTRFSLNIVINDAYLWDIRTRDNYHIVDDYIEMT